MIPLGIMQGRLLPPVDGKIQAFPADVWREEFGRAKQAGLDCIEWIVEVPSEERNPMGSAAGRADIREQASRTGIAVLSICADYYMVQRLVRADGTVDEAARNHLIRLIGQAEELGIRYMVLPFVDASSLKSERELAALKNLLPQVVQRTGGASVELHLETDLPPATLAEVLESVGEPRVRANFDMGNSASLGWDPSEELAHLRPWLGSVHVKDRVRGGGTVPLGRGSVDFKTVFAGIRAARFAGPLILQVARESGISETDLAIRNAEFVKRHWMN